MRKKTYNHVASGVDWDGWYKYTLQREDGKQIKVGKSRFRKLRDEGRISNVSPPSAPEKQEVCA